MKTRKEVEQIDKFCEENDLYSDLEITEAEFQGKKSKFK